MKSLNAALLSLALVMSIAAPAHADPRDLGDIMKDINAQAKVIKDQVADPTQNESTLELAKKMRGYIYEAEGTVPEDKILDQQFPDAAQRKLAPIRYQQAVALLFVEAGNLEIALNQGDNAAAAASFAKIGKMQREGHTVFKPKEE